MRYRKSSNQTDQAKMSKSKRMFKINKMINTSVKCQKLSRTEIAMLFFFELSRMKSVTGKRSSQGNPVARKDRN
ncbi:uncharacterized protein LOC117565367 isoform X2 [Drosophila albomicans]|uniref:Uncharacterized protein LOC117565367 isoform X2 n=1 Tax=Drosophila albomicans TaxID=7291 RepID=A0A9C6WCC0_DROAB|nr:uncharacterized protein LOC117565367 isoform X2 [Drosophila albomicans]